MDWGFPIELVAAFLVGVGFSLLYNVRGKIFLPAIGGAALCWLVNDWALGAGHSAITGAFFGGLAVAIWSEIFSRISKAPVTVFLIIGIFPIVPGGGIYNTMQGIISGDYAVALAKGVETIGIALALSLGVLIVSTVVRLLNFLRGKNFQLPRGI